MSAEDGPRFSLRPEHERLLFEARAVARNLAPLKDGSSGGRVNRELVAELGACGLLPRLFPKSAGGARDGAVSALELCLLREGLAQESTEAETALALQGLGGYPILQSGNQQTVKRWIPEIAAGRAVPAFALTEPNAGSDAASLELAAEVDADG